MACARTFCARSMRRSACRPVIVPIPYPCPNEIYEARMAAALEQAKRDGVTHVIFGDLFLEDVRAYRESKLAGTGITPLFPLWQRPTDALAREMIAAGVETYLVCVDLKQLPKSFAGRRFDAALLADLPAGIDPCGEKGEFHSCVVAGPMFDRRIGVTVGEIVERDGFAYTDFMPSTPLSSLASARSAGDPGPIGRQGVSARWLAGLALRGSRRDAPLNVTASREAPPVRFPTSATIFAATASISSSVIVLSRGCKRDGDRDRFLAGIDALALVEVEHRDAGNQLAVDVLRGAHQIAGLHLAVDHEREVARHRLERRQRDLRLGARRLRLRLGDAFEDHFEHHQRPFGIERLERTRMQLAEIAKHILRPDLDRAGASRMQPARPARHHLQRGRRRARRDQHGERVGFHVENVGLAVDVPVPARALGLARARRTPEAAVN